MGRTRGKVICFFSSKGGVGRTTLAANLAAAFGLIGQRAVAVDFDLHTGGIAEVLGIKPEKTIGDLINTEEYGKALSYLAAATGNVSVLGAPSRPELSLKLGSQATAEVLDVLKHDFEFVVVDLPTVMAEHAATTLEAADIIFLLAHNDNLSVRSTVFTLQNLALLGYALQSVRLIVNDFSWRGITAREIEEAVGMPVYWRLDRDKVVGDALLKGKSFVAFKPRAAASVGLKRLALALALEFGKVKAAK